MRASSSSLLAVALLASSASLLLLSPVSAHFAPHALSRVRVESIRDGTAAAAASGGSISIDAPSLHGVGSWVNVTWSGLSSTYPGNFDWIGVWSPQPTSYNETTPAKYKYVIPDATGSGTTSLWLVNMRGNYVVAYFTGGLSNPVLLAESMPVDFDNYHVPLQIHVALTDDPTQMRVMWNSAQNMFPSVSYGLSPSELSNSAMHVQTTSYAASDLCGAPATTTGWHDPGYLHTALLTNLSYNTQYYYQVGDESSLSKSAVLTFWSAPAPGRSTTDLDFFIFGDLGQVEPDGSNEASQMDGSILTTTAMAKDLEDGSIDLSLSAAVFHIGDISYARGYATLWEQFFYQISDMSPYLPWMTCDGNHERDFPNSGSLYTGHDSGGECGKPYEARFPMPTSAPDSTWYALNWGPVHWIILSTEHAFAPGSAQYDFVVADLAAVDRTQTPFLLMAGHRPMYIDSTNWAPAGGDQTTAQALRDAYEPLMKEYGVDAAFWGHHHSAQRSCAVNNGTCIGAEANGTVHIVTGAAGAGFSTNIEPTMPAWAEFVECNTHGYIRAHVRGDSLRLDFISANDRSTMDSVTIQSKFPQNNQQPQQQQQPQPQQQRPKAKKEEPRVATE